MFRVRILLIIVVHLADDAAVPQILSLLHLWSRVLSLSAMYLHSSGICS
jgi:hypothetical protein